MCSFAFPTTVALSGVYLALRITFSRKNSRKRITGNAERANDPMLPACAIFSTAEDWNPSDPHLWISESRGFKIDIVMANFLKMG